MQPTQLFLLLAALVAPLALAAPVQPPAAPVPVSDSLSDLPNIELHDPPAARHHQNGAEHDEADGVGEHKRDDGLGDDNDKWGLGAARAGAKVKRDDSVDVDRAVKELMDGVASAKANAAHDAPVPRAAVAEENGAIRDGDVELMHKRSIPVGRHFSDMWKLKRRGVVTEEVGVHRVESRGEGGAGAGFVGVEG